MTRRAFSLDDASTGNKIDARIAITAMTTNNSMSVKPRILVALDTPSPRVRNHLLPQRAPITLAVLWTIGVQLKFRTVYSIVNGRRLNAQPRRSRLSLTTDEANEHRISAGRPQTEAQAAVGSAATAALGKSPNTQLFVFPLTHSVARSSLPWVMDRVSGVTSKKWGLLHFGATCQGFYA